MSNTSNNLPPFDLDKLNEAMIEAGMEDLYDLDNPREAAEEARASYFGEALARARSIRDAQEFLATSKNKKERASAEKEMKSDIATLPTYVWNTYVFYGDENCDYLKGLLGREFGLQFDNFDLTPASIEAPIYTQETTMTAAAKKAKSRPVKIQDLTATEKAKPTKDIPLDQIAVSAFETQKRRRAHFLPEGIINLAQNIAANGLKQHISLRPKKGRGKVKYEIVFGERRYLAFQKLGRRSIPATVEKMTDEQAFETQRTENKEREALHPVDEAFQYKVMRDEFGHNVDEIALHVGETPSYVQTRLKLLELEPNALAAFENSQILLGHALEIAKHPAKWHNELLNLIRSGGAANNSLLTVPAFIQRIEMQLLHRLDKAPFPIKSPDLRADHLACPDCPQRTGASPLLFKETYHPKDQCQNPECWDGKTQAFVEIQRRRVAIPNYAPGEKIDNEQGKVVEAVPSVADEWGYGPNIEKIVYLRGSGTTEVKDISACKSVEQGVMVKGDRVGQVVYFCRAQSCKTHSSRSSSSSATKSPEQARDERMKRKEELVDIRVGEQVRKRVFTAAAEIFGKQFALSEPTYGKDLLAELSLWMYEQCGHEDTARVVVPALNEWDGKEKQAGTGFGVPLFSLEQFKERFDAKTMAQMVFLCLNADKGAMYFDSYSPQAEVRELAEKFGVDYQLIDAEIRLKYSQDNMKKHTHVFLKYYEDVKGGARETPIPRVYCEDYRPKA